MAQRRILAVYGHPDDEGQVTGTLARFIAEGDQVTLVCATRGEVGEISDPKLSTPETLWYTRELELRASMAQIGLADENDVIDGCVVRQAKAYPVYDDDYAANVDAVRRELSERFPNLHLVGRNGMHKYNNQDHAMMTAMLTVKNIEAGAPVFDIWNVNEDAEYHEAGGSGAQEALKSERLVPRKVGRVA